MPSELLLQFLCSSKEICKKGEAMKRIRVPEFLKTAIRNSARFLDTGNQALCSEQVETVALAVCKALMDHPQVPTDEQAQEILRDHCSKYGYKYGPWPTYSEFCEEWQRRMFVEEEPEIPEEIKDLLVADGIAKWQGYELNEAVIEAYRRGLRKGEQK